MFSVAVELFLNEAGVFHWHYWWWNTPFVLLIVIFGYLWFYLFAAWVFDAPTPPPAATACSAWRESTWQWGCCSASVSAGYRTLTELPGNPYRSLTERGDLDKGTRLRRNLMNAHGELDATDVGRQLDASSGAMLAAHDAAVTQASESVIWERHGWLGRLVRVERAPEQIDLQSERGSKPAERLVA